MQYVKPDWRPWLKLELQAIAIVAIIAALGYAYYQISFAPPPVLPQLQWEQSAATLSEVQGLRWQLQAADATPRDIDATCVLNLDRRLYTCSAPVPEWAIGKHVRLRAVDVDGAVVQHSAFSEDLLVQPRRQR